MGINNGAIEGDKMDFSDGINHDGGIQCIRSSEAIRRRVSDTYHCSLNYANRIESMTFNFNQPVILSRVLVITKDHVDNKVEECYVSVEADEQVFLGYTKGSGVPMVNYFLFSSTYFLFYSPIRDVI